MTKLGHSKMETRRMYLGEFIDKFRTYKKLFNLEKQSIYALDFEAPKQISSLRDL